jgi:hypothetical protein
MTSWLPASGSKSLIGDSLGPQRAVQQQRQQQLPKTLLALTQLLKQPQEVPGAARSKLLLRSAPGQSQVSLCHPLHHPCPLLLHQPRACCWTVLPLFARARGGSW